MSLRLHNTLTRQKETFTPIDPGDVRLYVCGPTVYDRAHIGNARPVIVFDVLFRLLRHLYGDDHVRYVRNITDVDDKIIVRAKERGIGIATLTETTTRDFQQDVAALGCLPPTVEPRATDHVPDMVTIIERLIAAGHAYAADGHVLFDVPSMPDYGKLSNRPLDEMIAGARVEVAPYKRGDTDFVLWKPAADDEPGWPSPWGRGRPGWHVECSAMSWKHLGETFDIHGGGIDLIFPHHENEIAQSRCAFHTPVMANIWMHNGFLQVEGQKMSKSLGNFRTICDVLEERRGYRHWGGVIRLNMLRTHYRQPIDWTDKALRESEIIYANLQYAIRGSTRNDATIGAAVVEKLKDDLNTPAAITELQRLAKRARSPNINEEPANAADQIVGSLELLGFEQLLDDLPQSSSLNEAVWNAMKQADAKEAGIDPATVEARIETRLAARTAKNWAESDRIRDELLAMGVALKDNKDGTTTWTVGRKGDA